MRVKGVSKYLDLFKQGQQVGDWTVQGDVIVNQYAKVPCKCKCGKESLIDAYTLAKGKSRSCISCFNSNNNGANNNSWKGYKDIPASWFTRFRNYAKKKGNCFEISLEDVWKVYEKQNKKCSLSGLNIGFKRVGINNHAAYTASLDRIDSKKGYSVDNIQLVHKDINIMKNAFDQDYFIQMCKAIVNTDDTNRK